MERTALRRRVLLPLLLAYVTIVALGAWRHEIRPAWLDRPAAWARALLRGVGFPPGVAVFSAEVSATPDSKITALCLDVRVVEADAGVRQLYPAAGARCPAPAPRWWVRGEEIALYRAAMSLRGAIAARRTGALHPSQERHAELLAESLAEQFRRQARSQGLAPERYALLWRESRQSYLTGVRSDRVVALLRWEEAAGGHVALSWRPDARRLAEHWPELGDP